MCGILGVAAREPLDLGLLDAIGLLRHRGPDGEGRYVDGRVGLAMRRLAIIDLETGDQPVANETREIVAVCNGELYNYRELRTELGRAGHTFRGTGDVETIPHLYERDGERFAEALRGMFAIALWDARRQRLLLARDRFGIKLLYLADTPHGLAFAFELAPLLALGADATVDRQALGDYLTLGYVPGPGTALTGIRRLEPGTTLVWEDGRTRERRSARSRRPTARWGSRRRCASRSGSISARTSRSRCSSPAASTRRSSPRSPPRSLARRRRSRSASATPPSTSSRRRGRSRPPSAATTTRSPSGPTPQPICPRSSPVLRSRSPTPPRSRSGTSAAPSPGTSRSRSRATAATSSSAATRATPGICAPARSAASCPRAGSPACSRACRASQDAAAARIRCAVP